MQPEPFAKRQMQGVFGLRIAIDWQKRARELGVYAAIGLFLAFLEPHAATRGLPFIAAFPYWPGLIILGSASGETARRITTGIWPEMPIPVRLAIISIASATAVTLAIFVIERVLNGRQIPLEFLPTLFGLVWVISAAMTGIGYMMQLSILAAPDAPEGFGPVRDVPLPPAPPNIASQSSTPSPPRTTTCACTQVSVRADPDAAGRRNARA